MADDAQDRHLPASQRKIDKAREDGQVARSRDLGHLSALGLGIALLIVLAPRLTDWLQHLLASGLRFDAASLAKPQAMSEQLSHQGLQMLIVVLPLGTIVSGVAVVASVLSGGWNFTMKPLEPKFEKLNPWTGLGRIFSMQQLADTGKACLLAVILGTIAVLYMKAQLPHFTALVSMPLPTALGEAGDLLKDGLLLMLLALAASALIDVPFQRQMLMRRLRMSVQEAKQEHKDVEGNTEVKGKIKAKMRELANRRMLQAVPQADLVVMNPTHFAVALKYDDSRMAAPRVVAKGADLMAFRIRDAAQGAKVPVLQAPPLARALYKHCEVDQEIPAALFSAVAQVLAWVFQLRAAVAAGRSLYLDPPDVEVPPGMDPLNPRVEPSL